MEDKIYGSLKIKLDRSKSQSEDKFLTPQRRQNDSPERDQGIICPENSASATRDIFIISDHALGPISKTHRRRGQNF